jgi:hypothetical protein
MKKFDFNNPVNNLPDVYKKSTESNNYKILETERSSTEKLYADIQDLFNSLDIDKATGETLDMYGEMLDQPRGLATDSQYRVLIKTKIMRNMSSGDYASVVEALRMSFDCDPSEIHLKDVEDTPCMVELTVLPYEKINSAGLTAKQVEALVQQLLPVGVRLKQYAFEGTFEFADTLGEYDEEAGFADNEGTIGGYLGTMASSSNEPILPV